MALDGAIPENKKVEKVEEREGKGKGVNGNSAAAAEAAFEK